MGVRFRCFDFKYLIFCRFINHSCEPNCKSAQWYVNSLRRIGLFTLKDVKAGEELTFDYNWERNQGCIQKCLCGTASCQNFLAAVI